MTSFSCLPHVCLKTARNLKLGVVARCQSTPVTVRVYRLRLRVGFYSPDEKWHLRNVSSDLFQRPLTGVAQVPLFDLVAFLGSIVAVVKGGGGGGDRL